MALPLGKLTIIVGAGLVGSVLAKGDFQVSLMRSLVPSRWFSGNLATVNLPLQNQMHNDSLLQQVHSLREELQLLVSNRPITIVTTSRGSASSKYSIILVVIGVGYGCIWWKGWKLSDMMFATKRSLSNACGCVSKQLENVYTSIADTKRHLTLRIDGVDGKIDECVGNTAATKEEVSKLRGDLSLMGVDVESVHHAVQDLAIKINTLNGKQGETLFGLGKLVTFFRHLETRRTFDIEEGEVSLLTIGVL